MGGMETSAASYSAAAAMAGSGMASYANSFSNHDMFNASYAAAASAAAGGGGGTGAPPPSMSPGYGGAMNGGSVNGSDGRTTDYFSGSSAGVSGGSGSPDLTGASRFKAGGGLSSSR